MPLKVKKIIIKYLTNSISAIELDHLTTWLENQENIELFNSYVKLNYGISTTMDKYSSEKVKEALFKKMNNDKRLVKKLKIKHILKYAAMAIFFLGIGYFYHMEVSNKVSNNYLKLLDDNQVILKLSDGSIEILSEMEANKKVNNFSDKPYSLSDNQLVYNVSVNNNQEELKYNTLMVPYGKRFKLVLADGTKVDLNAGSSLKYPVDFTNENHREVFLQGEAFFDVAKDANHPFIVNAENLNIRVLGTKFNVSAYQEDLNINTVLVEGSVGLFKKGEDFSFETSSLLEPGFKGSWHKTKQNVDFEEVNTEIYTGWVNGKVIFNHMQFKDILKVLERRYNVSIINNNKPLSEEVFTASFDTETIEQVFYLFNKSFHINYRIENNKILIN